MTGPPPPVPPDAREAWLALSGERDRQAARRDAAARDGFDRGREAGFREGFEAAHAELAAAWAAAARARTSRPAFDETDGRRWFLACPPCRLLAGPRPGCPGCEQRTPVTFAQPMPGEFTGRAVATGEVAGTRRGAA